MIYDPEQYPEPMLEVVEVEDTEAARLYELDIRLSSGLDPSRYWQVSAKTN